MATTPVTSSSSTTTSSSKSGQGGSNDALRGLNMDQFLKLMITELQNQDPLNPMDNNEVLQQIGEIRQVTATDKLTATLDSVLLGQSLSNASGLIGKTVRGLTDDSKQVSGVVDSVTVTGGVPKLHIGDQTLGLTNISDILPGAAS